MNERVGFKAKEIKDEIIKKSNTLWRHCGKIILTPIRKNYNHNALNCDVKRIVVIEGTFKTKISHFLSHLTIKFY